MLDRIFVYGTLQSTGLAPMAPRLANNAELIGKARVAGRLIDLGRYPGLLEPTGPNEWVDGEVWRLHTAEGFLPILDAYEGCGPDDAEPHEYDRVVREALLDTGEAVEVWVYVFTQRRG